MNSSSEAPQHHGRPDPNAPAVGPFEEPWDGRRWLKSRFSGRRIAKSAGILVDQVVVALVIGAFILAGLWIHGRTRPAAPPTPDVITATTANVDKSSSAKKTHVVNILPMGGQSNC